MAEALQEGSPRAAYSIALYRRALAGRRDARRRYGQCYARDFGDEGEVLEFVLRRLDDASVERAERSIDCIKLRYDAFDWALNRR